MYKIILSIFLIISILQSTAQNNTENNLDKQYTPPFSLTSNETFKREPHSFKNSIGFSPIFTLSHQILSMYYTRTITNFASLSISLGKSYGTDKTFVAAIYTNEEENLFDLTFNYGVFNKGRLFYELKFNLFTYPDDKNELAISLYLRNNKYQLAVNSTANVLIKQGILYTDINNSEKGIMFSYLFNTKRISHCIYLHVGYFVSAYKELNWGNQYYTLSSTEKEHKFVAIGAGYNIGFDF